MIDGFEDGKDAGAMRTIGEVGDALGIKPHVLRYWEQQFPMLDPLKRSGGRRYYRPEDIALVRRIDRLVNEDGYTIKGAIAVLNNATPDPEASDGMHAVTAPEPVSDGGSAVNRSAAETITDDLFAEGQVAHPAVTSRVAPMRAASPEVIARLKEIRATLAAAIAA